MPQNPQECPVCAAALRHHTPETANEFEEWEFQCGAILHRENRGKFFAYANCPDAMIEAIDRLNDLSGK